MPLFSSVFPPDSSISLRLRTISPRALVVASVLALAAAACSSDEKRRGGDGDSGEGGEGATAATGGRGGSGGSGTGGGDGGTGGSSGGSGGTGGSSGAPPDISELPTQEEADWTVFVYGHGDHNLSNSLLVDLREMAGADLGPDRGVNVIVLTDWNAAQAIPGSDPPVAFPQGIQLFRVPGRDGELEVVAEAAEQNLDDPGILASVVGDVFRAFPARRRGIVLWDHGGAWSGGFGSDTQNGSVERPVAMPAGAIPGAIQAGLEAAGVAASPPLDFVAFDTCLMAGAEVAYPFRSLASVYLANAEIDYGAGWDYTATFSFVAANREASPLELAEAELGHWDAHHVAASPNDALLRSHAALDLSKMEEFAAATGAFTSALGESAGFDPIELGQSGFFAQPPYASQFENAGSSQPGLRDAGQVLGALSQVSSDAALASAAADARAALAELVIGSSQGVLRAESEQAGLHVELSLASQITGEKSAEYAARAAEWIEASGWDRVLGALRSGADAEPPAFEHSVDNGDAASIDNPPLLRFSTSDADVAKAAVYLGVAIDDESIGLLGLVGSGSIEAESAYEFAWDGSVAVFDDGQVAMVDVWLDTGSDESVLMVPGLLEGAASEPLLTYLVFTPSEGAASVAVVSFGDVASTLSVSEIVDAAPSATFAPLYYVVDAASGETALAQGDAMGLPAGGAFAFETSYVDAGSFYLFTALSDVWGNQGAAVDAVELLEPLGE